MLVKPALHAKLLAEFVGTFTLSAVGIGAVLNLGPAGAGGLLGIAFAHGLAIGVMVTAIGHVSGGHINPAVTTAMIALRKIAPVEGLLYIIAQLAGGVAGAAVIKAIWTDKVLAAGKWDAGTTWNSAAQVTINPHIGAGAAMALEAVATFLLVWVVFAVAVDRDGAFFKLAGLPIGLMVLIDILMIGPLTGGTMNPSRWFGPNLLAGQWDNAWVYIVGPALGGLVAGAAYMFGIRPREADAA